MTRYQVTAWIGTLAVEVEAKDVDEAIVNAERELNSVTFWDNVSYEVRELGE